MNYFLTGEKQVGKSTIIHKILDDLNCDYGGFCTVVRVDELGKAEGSDKNFQMRVHRLLDSNTPVLGVLQRCNSEFVERIKAREDVVLYTIDLINREEMPSAIRDVISREIGVKRWN